MTNERIYKLIMKLGSLISDDYVWSNELRREFEKITTYLSSK